MNNFKNNNRRGRFKPNGDRGFRRNGNGHKSNGYYINQISKDLSGIDRCIISTRL